MSDQGTIFNADQASATQSESAAAQAVQTGTATQSQSEVVALLVGEGKKYRTVDELAKAYMSADDFIEKLKAENHDLREKATAAKTVDDVLERLNQHQSQPADKPANAEHVPYSELAKLVEQTVTGLETQKQKQSNLLKADAKMKEIFGDKAADKFAEVAVTPELKQVYMQLAAVDPDKFVALFGGNVPKNVTAADVGGTVNTTTSYSSVNGHRANQEGTKEFYDGVRKSNPSLYYSQEFQIKMDKAVRNNPSLYYGKRN